MVHFTKLVGAFASASLAAAVPISGRTSHDVVPSYGSYEPSFGKSYNYSPEESNVKEESWQYGEAAMPEELNEEPEHEQYEPPMYEAEPQHEQEDFMPEETTTAMHEESTVLAVETMYEEHTTTTMHEMPAETVKAEETAVQYGSGSWDKSGYNDCVSQCMAKFGGGSPNSYNMGEGETLGSVGGGATHTIIVAPQQGVLRYVPPFVDANIGDTIMFKWGANNHTVTKSSALLPCNKTADALFASGVQNKDFSFTQVVNETNPIYFHCATPGHCPKGMFGVINPAKADANSSLSAGYMISQANSSYSSYTSEMTVNDASANAWGSNYDMSSLPEWANEPMMENIMYMRNVIAMNPDIVDADGNVNLGSTSAPLMLPNDVNAVAASASESASTESADTPSTETEETPSEESDSDEAASASGAASGYSNGAGSLTSSKMVMGVAVALATFFLL